MQIALSQPLAEVQAWIKNRFEHESFGGLRGQDRVDLWAFMCFSEYSFFAKDVGRQISYDIRRALAICTSATCSFQYAINTELCDETAVLCCLLPRLTGWARSYDLLGQYALTGERYGIIFLRILRYLLRLPEHTNRLLNIFALYTPQSDSGLCPFPSAKPLAKKALPECIERMPLSVELYFFVSFLDTLVDTWWLDNDRVQELYNKNDGKAPHSLSKSIQKYLDCVSAPSCSVDTPLLYWLNVTFSACV